MVLKILGTAANALPFKYYLPIGLVVVATLILRAFSQGRRTNRERDLHARVILVTGGFTPLGLTLIDELATRGAHVISLSPEPIDSPRIDLLVNAIRETTKNEQVYAEHCDLTSPNSIRAFCTQFLTGQEHRIDAIVFAHEYAHMGSRFSRRETAEMTEARRKDASLATFLTITLLLPALLVAPVERDIRIVNVVNPFYAAAIPFFFPSQAFPTPEGSAKQSNFVREGLRSLRIIVLSRHLQRVLDSLPSSQVPEPKDNAVPVVSDKTQKSNIVAVSVSPGISRADTIAPLLGAARDSNGSWTSLLLYVTLLPILHLLTKASFSAVQSMLHVLFLPTPFKHMKSNAAEGKAKSSRDPEAIPEEILKPGALYSECAVINLKVPSLPPVAEDQEEKEGEGEGVLVADDGELGGEAAGRAVWEAFEVELKAWEKANPPPSEEKKKDATQTSKGPSK